jgi:hypothetical protein
MNSRDPRYGFETRLPARSPLPTATLPSMSVISQLYSPASVHALAAVPSAAIFKNRRKS